MYIHNLNCNNSKSMLVVDVPFTCSCGHEDVMYVPVTRSIDSLELAQSQYICTECEFAEFDTPDFN